MQPVQKTVDSPGAVFEEVVGTPVDVSTTGAMVQTVQKIVWGSSDQFIDKVWKV